VTECILKNLISFYTTTFGKNTKEKEERDITFIILMETLLTTQLIILKSYQLKNTCKNIFLTNEENGRENGQLKSDLSQKIGILQKKVVNGTVSMQEILDLVFSLLESVNAKYADLNLLKELLIKNSVQTNVNLNTEEIKDLITLQEFVKNVEKNLSSINTQEPNFAVDHVQTVTYGGIAEEVYDLTVEDQHEFFANGILVHNCIDACRYACERESQM